MIARIEELLPALGVVDLVRQLVQAPSHPGLPRQEEQVVKVLAQYFEQQGVEFTTVEVRSGRPNLIATVRARATGPRLLLCGHTDTVPPNAITTANPFSAEIREGRMYGRGTVDMKGALAAMAATLAALQRFDLLARGEVILAAVVDEEMESLGAEALIRSGMRAEGAIVGEPTNNRIAIGHKGLEWLEIEFLGRATHGGTPDKGCNAISAAARFMRMVEEELVPQFQTRRHEIIGVPTINMGTIHGGDQPSTVAAHCTLQLDRRRVPAENIALVFSELEEFLARVRSAMPGLSTRLRRVPGGMATMVHGPLEIAQDHPLVLSAQNAYREVFGAEQPLTAFPAWTDAALLAREAGIPCLVCGPGDLSLAHSAEESVTLQEIDQAVLLYVTITDAFFRHRNG
ncbi:MAG: M20 family metallopeptidase [bacterium]